MLVQSGRRLVTGESTSAAVAVALSEQVYTTKHLVNASQANVYGTNTHIQTVQAGNDPASNFLGALNKNELGSALISSTSLVSAIPHLYKIASSQSSFVIHVSAENDKKKNTFGDFSNVMAVRQTGFALLSSSSVQEAQDLAAIAHLASIKSSTPFLHFFDSSRVAHEHTNIEQLTNQTLADLISNEEVEAYRNRPQQTNNESTYLRYKQRKDQESQEERVDVYKVVEEAMVQFASVTGRHYLPLEYTGHPDAENVIVAMGAGATVVESTLQALREQSADAKIGVLKVRLYRPWSNTELLKVLPSSVKNIAVLEPSHDYTSTWNPVFLDVAAAYQSSQNDEVEIVSGQYGVDAADFTPSMVNAVYEHLTSGNLKRRFVIGDSLTVTDKHAINVTPESSLQLVVVGDEAEVLSAFDQLEDKKVQVYTVEENGASVSHVRIAHASTSPVPSLIDNADLVVLLDATANVPNAVGTVKVDGNVIINNTADLNAVSGSVKKAISAKNANVYTTDAVALIKSADVAKFDNSNKVDASSWSSVQAEEAKATPATKAAVQESDVVETPYIKMLDQVFGDRLSIANGINAASVWSPDTQSVHAANPEFGYGKILAQNQQRAKFFAHVEQTLNNAELPEVLYKALSQWLLIAKSAGSKHQQVTDAATTVEAVLEQYKSEASVQSIVRNKEYLFPKSNWLVGSDSWSYDIGQSGVHHVITSGENVNMLIVDTTPYSSDAQREQRKKDVGLYAMNYGDAYVASVAIYSSYTGVLHALIEADNYEGPSIVLAFLPRVHNAANPIEVLQETKVCVDNGSWPLYRWNPALESEGKDPFTLDSERIKKDLEAFLERENHLSVLVSQQPDLAKTLVSSVEADVKKRHEELKRKAREDYARLLSGLSGNANGAPVTILFGSDNGNAEGLAKKLAAKGKSRGLKVSLMAMDDFADIQELANVTNVVVVVSTAGQGEFPSNGREFWKALNNLAVGDIALQDTKFAVFGLGDSHYWPREEDAVYYNRPGKLIDNRLEMLGAGRLIPEIGLGDDQDADGFETGFQAWQPELWKALGVADVGTDDEPPKLTDDQMKIDSNYLRGTIAQDLEDESTGAISEINGKLLKFHGSYGQDDRDIREERKKQGLEKAFSFMIRVRMPGGVATPEQWLVMDELAETHANGDIKLTTRQAFQLHGIIKKKLKPTIRGVNKSLLSTLAACGDVNRNIMMNPNPYVPEVYDELNQFANKMMQHLAPKTNAYHEIWLADEMVAGHAVQDFEPIYGPTYLPRKFKIVIAVPPNNDVDIFAHDLGFIAIINDDKTLAGFNVTVGGGMGMTHGNKKTYPRPASIIGFCTVDEAVNVAEKVMTTQRDYGDRTNRKHARLKYTIDDRGLDWFKGEVESRLGYKLGEERPYKFTDNADRYGWTKGVDDKWHFGMFIENGKVKDWPDLQIKTGLRELAKWHKGDFRLTPNQHLVIANVPEADLERTKAHLAKYKLDNLSFTSLRLNAMACVALPTCGLAMAESERYLPTLVGLLESTIEEAGLRDDAITIRMTGCPNGCARPYLGEIAFVGKAPGAYNIYLGGGHKGERLNKLYKESLKEEEILAEVKPIIKRYALERNPGEHFGDWVIRAGYVKKTITGTDFHEL
ncbi:thiamine diphosphate-binding protein [Umbelopsis sp. PMI_123]|nr:thiamine diphosphate-binding protein [Umbelopsis sp. PMI_123]